MPRNNRIRLSLWTVVLAASVGAAFAADLRRASDGITRTSRPVRLLRSYEETVKINGKDHPRQVRVVFDYAKGEAREESYDKRGILLATRRITETLPAPSREEITEAFSIVRAEPALASIFGRFEVVLEGGFLLEESAGMPCGPGSRCLHVFLLGSDRSGLIRRVVVNLSSRSIPYLVYAPPAFQASR